jgi:hypothetical protein
MSLVNEGCGVDIFIEPYNFYNCYSRLKALAMNKINKKIAASALWMWGMVRILLIKCPLH